MTTQDLIAENRFDTIGEAIDRQNELNDLEPGQWFWYDAGYCVGKYKVAKLPQVGEEVSMYFNGDAYPCGTITSVSKSGLIVKTSEGRTFRRQAKHPACWLHEKTFAMIPGRVSKQNPSF